MDITAYSIVLVQMDIINYVSLLKKDKDPATKSYSLPHQDPLCGPHFPPSSQAYLKFFVAQPIEWEKIES